MKNRYIACMVLHSVGDTVGFKNGEWEFKQGSIHEKTLDKLYEFIDLGGVNQISLKNWIASDDTIMHIKTAQAILENYTSINTFGNVMKTHFLSAYEQFNKEGIDKRFPGQSTMMSLKKLSSGANWNEIPYDILSGGSGASMRSLCIGLAYHGESDRDKLIQLSIESGRMTNNSAVGYLGGLATALFTALAIENVKINDWPGILLELLNTKVQKYINSSNRDIAEYNKDHHVFVEKWHKYIENKFDSKKNPIVRKSDRNLVLRGQYYHEAYGFGITVNAKQDSTDTKIHQFIGSGGDDSVIIAYDCLFDAKDNWEKLVIYSMLHGGDTDTTGSISAGLYGALYGMEHIPPNYTEYLEYKKELIDIGSKLYNKFNK